MNIIPEILITQWYLFGWKDCIEILFFSMLFYYFSLWLKHDKQKNLLFNFYAYCLLIVSAYALNLSTLHSFLILYAPIALLLLIITHQHILQRNFITFKNITPDPHAISGDWLGMLVRSSLHAMSKNKPLLYIIEQENSLKQYFQTLFYLRIPVDHTILTMLIDSPSFEHDKIIWINHQGTINAINCTWKDHSDYVIFQTAEDNVEKWKQDALLFTTKTDALVLYCCPGTNSFTIIAEGKLVENVSASSTLRILKQYIKSVQTTQKKGQSYETNTQKPSSNQLHT